MDSILNMVGYDLAEAVKQQMLPLTALDIAQPKFLGKPFLDSILLYLIRPMNSMFFVDDDLGYINSYINSLALLFDNHDEFLRTTNTLIERFEIKSSSSTSQADLKRWFENMQAKRLYMIDIVKLTNLGGETIEEWDPVCSQFFDEVQKGNYYVVIPQINHIFKKTNSKTKNSLRDYQGRRFFFATRGKVRITFLAPLLWTDYSQDIEHGGFPALIQHRRPILFSPRPSKLSEPQFSPDKNFTFE